MHNGLPFSTSLMPTHIACLSPINRQITVAYHYSSKEASSALGNATLLQDSHLLRLNTPQAASTEIVVDVTVKTVVTIGAYLLK